MYECKIRCRAWSCLCAWIFGRTLPVLDCECVRMYSCECAHVCGTPMHRGAMLSLAGVVALCFTVTAPQSSVVSKRLWLV